MFYLYHVALVLRDCPVGRGRKRDWLAWGPEFDCQVGQKVLLSFSIRWCDTPVAQKARKAVGPGYHL